MNAITLFSGGGLVECGLKSLGITPVLAVEMDVEIALVYKRNHGSHVQCVRTCDVDPAPFAGVDLLWASPPCQSHSVARSKTLDERDDADAGLDILRWTGQLRPRFVFIENVPGYAKHPVFESLVLGLKDQGYGVEWRIIDFANYGVPQNRKRVILRAKYGVERGCAVGEWPATEEPRGWYQAVEDLLPSCPESAFAPWQLRRLPAWFTETVLVEPDAAGARPPTVRVSDEPAYTMKTSGGVRAHRAFLVSDRAKSNGVGLTMREENEPACAQRAAGGGRLQRAFLVNGDNTSRDCTVRPGDEPSFGMTRTSLRRPASDPRALLVAGGSAGKNIPYVEEGEPSFTVKAVAGGREPLRAAPVEGRVVALTPRCIARLQTVPDSYILPEKRTLAGTVVGNGVPCEGCRRIVEATING